MPSRNPDGSRLSGAQIRDRKRAKQERGETERQSGEPSALADLEPPPENTAELVRWGAVVLAKVIHRAAQKPEIFAAESDQLKFIADGCAKLGIVRDKAKEQEDIAKQLKAARGEQKAQGMERVSGRTAPAVARPSGRPG